MGSEVQQRYMEVLGVKPGATLDELQTAYYTQLERLSGNPTEEEAAEQAQIRHAYAILRRSCENGEVLCPAPEARRLDPKATFRKVTLALAVAALVLVAMNLSWIRMSLTHHEPGAVLVLRDGNAPYGTVVRYEDAHRFHTGRPTPAYEIRLASGQTVWLSARVVAKGMVAKESAGAGR